MILISFYLFYLPDQIGMPITYLYCLISSRSSHLTEVISAVQLTKAQSDIIVIFYAKYCLCRDFTAGCLACLHVSTEEVSNSQKEAKTQNSQNLAHFPSVHSRGHCETGLL